jgi:hypothetical protein
MYPRMFAWNHWNDSIANMRCHSVLWIRINCSVPSDKLVTREAFAGPRDRVTTWLRPGRRGHRDSLAMGEKVRRARGMTKQNKTQNTEHRNDEGCGEMITQSSSSSPFNSSVASIQRTCERIIKCPQNRKLVLSSAIHRHPMICIYICTSRRGCVLPPSIPTANLTLARLPHSSAEELNPSKLPSRILTPPPANLSTLVPTKHLQLRLATPHRHIQYLTTHTGTLFLHPGSVAVDYTPSLISYPHKESTVCGCVAVPWRTLTSTGLVLIPATPIHRTLAPFDRSPVRT